MKIQAALFDLDRTLSDRDTAFLRFAQSQFARLQPALKAVPENEYVSTLVRLDAKGLGRKEEVYQEIERRFSANGLSWQELFHDFETRIADFYITFPHVHETLGTLQSRGIPLAIVSNGRTDFQRQKIQRLKLEPYFSAILISEAEGLRKPDAAIFHRACARLQVLPEHALLVGDNLQADIEGARRAGLMTAWKKEADHDGTTMSDFDFDDMSQLLAWIDKN